MKKIFIIAMSVILMSLLCIPAFASEAEHPPGTSAIQNGVSFDSKTLVGGDIPAFFAVEGREYTITGLSQYARLYGISSDGTRTCLDVSFVSNAPYVYVADGTYPYIGVDAGVSNVTLTTVTWEEPGLLDYGFSFLEFFVSGGLSVLDMLVLHPVTRLLISGSLAIGVFIIFRVLI